MPAAVDNSAARGESYVRRAFTTPPTDVAAHDP
jgi:hypothetical protein